MQRIFARFESVIIKSIGIIGLLALWELSVALGWANASFFSSPTRIVAAAVQYARSDQFVLDVSTSAWEFAGGFGLALVVGTALGFAVGWYRRLEYLFDPVINFLYASPRIALTPLLILWLGIGQASKVAVIFLMSVFPVIINTALGVRSVDRDLLDLARSFNASQWQILRTIVVPYSVPYVVTGVRLAIGVGFIGVVVGEFVASTAGIGFSIQQAASTYEVDLVFVGLMLIGGAGVALTEALRYLEKKLAKWKVT